ncbi:MAG: NADH-quinone oxidoreductase subunit M [Verrucomicrobiota bacterium]
MITWLILTPLAGALAVMLLPRSVSRPAALVFNALAAVLALMLWHGFNTADGTLQMVVHHDWIPKIGAEYRVGIDGLSLMMVLLTSLIIPFALFAQRQDRPFCALMLFVQAALYGTFTAQNFILWFLFYEMSLLPAFLLIKIWGGENRDRAATKFFVYTFLGSIAMLVSFLAIFLHTGTLDFTELALRGKQGLIHGNFVWLVFAGIFIGLAVKVPVFPLHTWLPDAYASAPVGVSMVLTGLLSKMGVYGFIRLLLPLFPHEIKILAPTLLGLAVCSIVFAALAAWAQTDLKRMLGYLSISHLGYCMLGLFAVAGGAGEIKEMSAALGGVFMQIFNHGLTAATLFYFAGLLEQRRGSRDLRAFGGLMQRTPLLCGWMSVAMFSSLGLPGLNGFIGEFLIFKGSFALAAAASSVAVIGLLVTAVVFLRAMQLLFSGPLAESCQSLPDLAPGEKLVIVPVTLLMFALGVAPQFMFNLFNSTVLQMARFFGS